MRHVKKIAGDPVFFGIVAVLVIGGLFVFSSASLGLLARASAAPERMLLTQLLFGLVPGVLAVFFLSRLPQATLIKVAPYVYGITVLATLLVFTPLGEEINGARRWIDLGFTTVQPSEFMKIGVVLLLGAYLAKMKGDLSDIRRGLIPFGVIVGIPFLILLAEPNTSTVIVLALTALVMYIAAGAPFRDVLIIGLASLCMFAVLVAMRPYLLERVKTFVTPSRDPLSSGYQVQQSLIAIGSGGLLGRGFGQSVQKFNYLPEPVGDSVFAVYGEEFGFLGTTLLLLLFLAFAARGFSIAINASSLFGSLIASGFTTMITASAFLNMGAMLALFPLTGLPLPFISHGGTALFAMLICVGIILNVSVHKKATRG